MNEQYKKIRSLTLKQLAYALAAADAGNVTAASRQLHVSQPAVSTAIAALEQHYGLKLFTRLPAQGVVLTPFGIEVMSEARLLLDQAQTVAQLSTPDAKIAGQLVISCYEAIAPFVLPRLLHTLQARLPKVSVNFIETSLEGAALSLKQGTADLAISYALGHQDNVYKQNLYTLQPRVICSTEHAFAELDVLPLAQLHGQKMILLDQPMSAQYVLGLLSAHGAEPDIVTQVKSIELQRSLVANNFGLALVHTLAKANQSYDGRPIKTIAIADAIVAQKVQVTCLQQSRKRPILDAVLTEIQHLFSGN
jgi:DNA-binding transcriptional LysR family regulator